MKLRGGFLCTVFLFLTVNIQAQYRDRVGYNRLGLQAGVTYGGIITNDFNTANKISYTAGFGTRANFYNNLIMMYGVNFYEFKTGVGVKENLVSPAEEIDFKDIGVQINLFIGQKIIGEHFGVEIGPVLQINGKWKPDDQYANYYIEGYSLRAKDVEDIATVNLNAALNLSGGFQDFKFWLQYQYGVNNSFKPLNDNLKQLDPAEVNLEGHLGLATFGIVFYL